MSEVGFESSLGGDQGGGRTPPPPVAEATGDTGVLRWAPSACPKRLEISSESVLRGCALLPGAKGSKRAGSNQTGVLPSKSSMGVGGEGAHKGESSGDRQPGRGRSAQAAGKEARSHQSVGPRDEGPQSSADKASKGAPGRCMPCTLGEHLLLVLFLSWRPRAVGLMGWLGVLVTRPPGPDLDASAPLTTPPRRKKLYSSMLSLPEVSRIFAHIWKLNSSLWRSNSVRQVYLGDRARGGGGEANMNAH